MLNLCTPGEPTKPARLGASKAAYTLMEAVETVILLSPYLRAPESFRTALLRFQSRGLQEEVPPASRMIALRRSAYVDLGLRSHVGGAKTEIEIVSLGLFMEAHARLCVERGSLIRHNLSTGESTLYRTKGHPLGKNEKLEQWEAPEKEATPEAKTAPARAKLPSIRTLTPTPTPTPAPLTIEDLVALVREFAVEHGLDNLSIKADCSGYASYRMRAVLLDEANEADEADAD